MTKSNSQGHGTPSFHIQIMDTRRCVLILRDVQEPQRCLRILSFSLEAIRTSHHRCLGTIIPNLEDYNRALNSVAFYFTLLCKLSIYHRRINNIPSLLQRDSSVAGYLKEPYYSFMPSIQSVIKMRGNVMGCNNV